MPSAFKDVIRQLQRQKIAIDRAIAALQEVGDETADLAESSRQTRPAKKRRKRTMSAEARKRISEAVRKRWAAAKKKAAGKQAKKAAE
jgi:ABC-type transporter Mla subunit MlaD